MSNKYTIEWITKGTTAGGKPKADATIKGEDGQNIDVTIWGDFPGYADIQNGGTIEGDIRPSSNPNFKPSLSAPVTSQNARSATARGAVMEKAMDRKEKAIERFQETKEISFKIHATFTKAVETALAEWQDSRRLSSTGPDMESLYKKWRTYYWNNYDIDPSNEAPF